VPSRGFERIIEGFNDVSRIHVRKRRALRPLGAVAPEGVCRPGTAGLTIANGVDKRWGDDPRVGAEG